MAYESDYAGIGVGKTFGVKSVGGVTGQTKTLGKELEATFEFESGTVDQPYDYSILQDYLITELTLYVEEAFAAGSTAQLSVDSGAGLTTALDLTATGVSKPALTGLANTSGTGPAEVALDLSDADTQGSETGRATLVVTYERI